MSVLRALRCAPRLRHEFSRVSLSSHRESLVSLSALVKVTGADSASSEQNDWLRVAAAAAIGLSLFAYGSAKRDDDVFHAQCAAQQSRDHGGVEFETDQVVTNWSATHTCHPRRVYEPQSTQELLSLLQSLHAKAQRESHFRARASERARPVGTALSPNGLAFSDDALISLHALNEISVDAERRLVTVGAGARVSDVLAALRKHGLTLSNFSSIQEQQLGGWTQVAAHGTGVSLSTVDEMVVHMLLATPSQGLLSLSHTQSPQLFSLAKVGLGALGVVTQLTLQCVPAHTLREHTFSVRMSEVAQGHVERLAAYRHVRYMWMPHARDTVVAVVSNPVDHTLSSSSQPAHTTPADPAAERVAEQLRLTQQGQRQGQGEREPATAPLSALLIETRAVHDETEKNAIRALSFSQLRDALLDIAPLSLPHVQRVNTAEAAFWRNATATREADSVDVLGFDCGGEQLVFEVCFPMGTLAENLEREKKNSRNKTRDIEFVERLMSLIEKHEIPAHCPIEQRWTARSTAGLSPAHSPREDEVFSWVGVILYLPPSQSGAQREEIQREFERYKRVMQPLLEEFNAHAHWAKIELPREDERESEREKERERERASWWAWLGLSSGSSSEIERESADAQRERMRRRLRERFPVDEFNAYRRALDPHGVLSNKIVDSLFDN